LALSFTCIQTDLKPNNTEVFKIGEYSLHLYLWGIKEGSYGMEHWMLYANNESWNTASKTNDGMYGD